MDEADRYLPASKEILYINDGKGKGGWKKIKNDPSIPEELNVVGGKDKLFSHSKQEGGWKTEKSYGPPFLKEQVGGKRKKKFTH